MSIRSVPSVADFCPFVCTTTLSGKLHNLGMKRAIGHDQPPDGDRQLETARPGSARVDKQHAITLLDAGLMGMAEDDGLNACRSRVNAEHFYVMEHVDADAADLDQLRLRQTVSPHATVHVAAHGNSRRDTLKRSEDVGAAQIASVDDHVSATERSERFMAQQAMRVRNQCDDTLVVVYAVHMQTPSIILNLLWT